MKPVPLLAALLFALVAIAHALRLFFRVSILVGGVSIPLWVSLPGVIVPATLAYGLWREARRDE